MTRKKTLGKGGETLLRANFPPQKGVSLSRLRPLHFVPVKIGLAGGVKTPRNWATCLPVESIELPTAFLLLQMCRGKVRIVFTLAPPHNLEAQACFFTPTVRRAADARLAIPRTQKRGEEGESRPSVPVGSAGKTIFRWRR